MKKWMNHKVKKSVVMGALALAVIIAGFVIVPENAKATDEEVVKYQKVTDFNEFIECINNEEIPVCTLEDAETIGYLFAGWYKNADGEREPIESAEGLAEDTVIEAKFIPAHLARVACQVQIDEETSGPTKLRIVSIVDSTDYKAAGFNVYKREKQNDDTYTEEQLFGHDAANKAESENVYESLKVYESADGEAVEKSPVDVFGEDAENFMFTTGILDIPQADKDTTMVMKPYWITLDGTYVEGMGEFNRASDGDNNIVNVSVNLNAEGGIAAGMLDITIPEGFEVEEIEPGRVFEEMSFEEKDNIIKCIGIVADITENAQNANDVYVNLRLKKTDDNDLSAGEAEFKVQIPENGFCDKDEESVDVSAETVKY